VQSEPEDGKFVWGPLLAYKWGGGGPATGEGGGEGGRGGGEKGERGKKGGDTSCEGVKPRARKGAVSWAPNRKAGGGGEVGGQPWVCFDGGAKI